MFGWIFNIDALTRILPNQVNMRFITAFAFFLSSITLWFIDQAVRDEREIPQIILPATTTLILLIMTTLVAAGIFNVPNGLTELFVENNIVETAIPGMPALPTMINFVLFGVASILVLFELSKLKQRLLFFGIPIILVGVIACFGYLFQIPLLYYKVSDISTPMAFNTAIMFVFLGFGLILSKESQKYENKP